MSKRSDFRPFFSVLIILFTMLTVVFSKMEVRRMGYTLLKDSRTLKTMQETKRLHQMNLASLTRPERIESLAQKNLSLKRASKGQIVQISGERIVLQN